MESKDQTFKNYVMELQQGNIFLSTKVSSYLKNIQITSCLLDCSPRARSCIYGAYYWNT